MPVNDGLLIAVLFLSLTGLFTEPILSQLTVDISTAHAYSRLGLLHINFYHRMTRRCHAVVIAVCRGAGARKGHKLNASSNCRGKALWTLLLS